jgi:hypothetical protein
MDRLVEEAMKKSDVIWLALPGAPQPRPAWHIWHDGNGYVITGGIEQPLPGLPDAGRVVVTVRSKDKRNRLASWVAEVGQVEPGGEEWQTVVPLLAKERLNAPDGEAQVERWAREVYVIRLAPTGEVTDTPDSLPAGYASVRPVPTPATTTGKGPFMIGARRRRVDR